MNQGFMSQIQSEDILRDGAKYFDEIMILHNLFGYRESTNISIVNDIANAIFNVRFDSPEECKKTYTSLNNIDYTVYGKRFSIIMSIIDDYTIQVTMIGA